MQPLENPIHSLRPYLRSLDAGEIPDELLVSEETLAKASQAMSGREVYFHHLRPPVNTMLAYFLTHIYPQIEDYHHELLPVFRQELPVMFPRSGAVDHFDAYQQVVMRSSWQYAMLDLEQTMSDYRQREPTALPVRLWTLLETYTGPYLDTYHPEHAAVLDNPQDPLLAAIQTRPGKKLFTGVDTSLRFYNVFRLIRDETLTAFPDRSGNKGKVACFEAMTHTAEQAYDLTAELTRLPLTDQGTQLLARVLTGKDLADKRVNPRYFTVDIPAATIALSAQYWQEKRQMIAADGLLPTTLCIARYPTFSTQSGERSDLLSRQFRHAMDGAEEFLFAPSAGVRYIRVEV